MRLLSRSDARRWWTLSIVCSTSTVQPSSGSLTRCGRHLRRRKPRLCGYGNKDDAWDDWLDLEWDAPNTDEMHSSSASGALPGRATASDSSTSGARATGGAQSLLDGLGDHCNHGAGSHWLREKSSSSCCCCSAGLRVS